MRRKKGNRTLKITMTGLMIALVFVVTGIIPPIPYGVGYLNFGDAIVLLSGFLLGPLGGFLAGGLGSAMADWYLGFNQYIIFTLVVKGLVGMVAGFLFRKYNIKMIPFYLLISVIIQPFGYFITEWIFLGIIDKQYGIVTAVGSLPGNTIQALVGLLLAMPLVYGLRKHKI